MSDTATIIKTMPVVMAGVSCSRKTNTPTATAVTGSKAPSTAVEVEPIRRTAYTIDTHEIIVQRRLSAVILLKSEIVVRGCSPPERFDLSPKKMQLIRSA